MTTLNTIIEEERCRFAKELSQSVRYFCGKGQYEENSDEQKAYLDGVETAIGMMFIDITETPKSKGLFTTAMQRAYEVGREENPLKGERRRIIEQIREERDAYWKERVEAKDEYWGKKYNELERRYFNALDRVNCACEVHEPLLDNLK